MEGELEGKGERGRRGQSGLSAEGEREKERESEKESHIHSKRHPHTFRECQREKHATMAKTHLILHLRKMTLYLLVANYIVNWIFLYCVLHYGAVLVLCHGTNVSVKTYVLLPIPGTDS